MGNRLNSVLVASAVLMTASMFSPVAAEETATKAPEVVAESATPVVTTPVVTETARPRAAAVDAAPAKTANAAVGYAKTSVRPATHRPRRAAYRSATQLAWSYPSRPYRIMFLGIGF